MSARKRLTQGNGRGIRSPPPKDKIRKADVIFIVLASISIIIAAVVPISIYLKNKDEMKKAYEALLSSGDRFMDQNDYRNAMKKYEEAKKIFPADYKVSFKKVKAEIHLLGNLYDDCSVRKLSEEERQDIKKIDGELAALETLNPNDLEVLWLYGLFNEFLHEFQKAEEFYSHAISTEPSPRYYTSRGVLYRKMKKDSQALEDFNAAIELNPEFWPAYVNRGDVFSARQEYKKAQDDYNRSLSIQENSNAYCSIGLNFLKYGKYVEAINYFTKAIYIEPHQHLFYYNRGLAYAQNRQPAFARSDFDKAISINPNNY